MKSYFCLQIKMLNRKLIELGIPLLIGYILIPIAFVFLSQYLFTQTVYAKYLYCILALSLVIKLNIPQKNDFLKITYSKKDYYKIKFLENLIYLLPFLLFMIYKEELVLAILLFSITVTVTLFNFNTNFNIVIPTPFSKTPFEFIVGFRTTFLIFPIAYFLVYMAILVDNFNLGAFSLILIGLTCLSYYTKPENEYFVWSYSLSPKQFLQSKIKTAILNFSILVLPNILGLMIFFSGERELLGGIYLLCLIGLITTILAKYAAYPEEMGLPQSILLIMSLIVPPVVLITIPYFYFQSIQKLNTILK